VVLGPVDSLDEGSADAIHEGTSTPRLYLTDCVSKIVILLNLILADKQVPTAPACLLVAVPQLQKLDVMGVGRVRREFPLHFRLLLLLLLLLPGSNILQLHKNAVDDFVFLVESFLKLKEELAQSGHLHLPLSHLYL
jgi:hypothetical protein